MNYSAVLFGFVSLTCASLLSAADVTVDDSTDDDDGGHHRTFRFAAKCGRDELLVVHGTRWEDGRKVLEIEEVIAAPDAGAATFQIELTEATPRYWQLREAGAEQHLQGVRLGRVERGSGKIEMELVPVTAKRTYRFTWEAHVETKAEIRRHHRPLPGMKEDRARQILYPATGGRR